MPKAAGARDSSACRRAPAETTRQPHRVDAQLLNALATIVAVMASVVGIVGAIDQLTAGSRHRRFSQFLQASIQGGDVSPAQRDVLVSLHQETVAKLVARSAVPGWRLAPELLTWFGSLLVAMVFGQAWFLPPSGQWVVPVVALGAGGFATPSLRRVIRLMHERRRVADDFVAGTVPIRPRIEGNELSEGRRFLEYVLAGLLGLGSVLGAAAFSAMTVDPAATGPTWYLMAGAGSCLIASTFARRYLRPRDGFYWSHPRGMGGSLPDAVPRPAEPRSVTEVQVAGTALPRCTEHVIQDAGHPSGVEPREVDVAGR